MNILCKIGIHKWITGHGFKCCRECHKAYKQIYFKDGTVKLIEVIK